MSPAGPGKGRAAVLLVNLGTPEAPTPASVRRYLRQFLSDPRVVEFPRFAWLPILYGIVLIKRPKVSAKKYASIWMPEGSPLRVHTERQEKLLRGYLGERLKGDAPAIGYAMRYGAPSIGAALDALGESGAARVLVIPLYPQYAASTTASVEDEIAASAAGGRLDIRMVKDFHDDPGYIRALARQLVEHREKTGPLGKLLFSFHGLPRRAIDRGDPYRDQCMTTARLLAREAGLAEGSWQVSFQSRFGAAEWIQPYTAAVLQQWGREGVKRVDVLCPGFVSDCLETLEEIGIEGRHAFQAAGGAKFHPQFHLIPCLNERHDWIEALSALALGGLGGPGT